VKKKLRFFVLLLRNICHKVRQVIIIVGPSDMDEQLVHVGAHLSQGLNVFENSVSMDRNVQVKLSLGPKTGGLNVKALASWLLKEVGCNPMQELFTTSY
jgi:hypothetical protein